MPHQTRWFNQSIAFILVDAPHRTRLVVTPCECLRPLGGLAFEQQRKQTAHCVRPGLIVHVLAAINAGQKHERQRLHDDGRISRVSLVARATGPCHGIVKCFAGHIGEARYKTIINGLDRLDGDGRGRGSWRKDDDEVTPTAPQSRSLTAGAAALSTRFRTRRAMAREVGWTTRMVLEGVVGRKALRQSR